MTTMASQHSLLIQYILLVLIATTANAAFQSNLSNNHALISRGITRRRLSTSAQDLLYQDQQDARARRAAVEKSLLANHAKELLAPKLPSSTSGTGFASSNSNNNAAVTKKQVKVLQRDGVLRVDKALSAPLADKVYEFVLEQQRLAEEYTRDGASSREFYGVETQRQNRCDLHLSLMRGGYAAGRLDNRDSKDGGNHVVADALQELLGASGTLRSLYETLVTREGEFYEFASVITHPGSHRQQIHPDLPFRSEPPLYVVFVALQDVTLSMGPTTFLLGTHTYEETERFHDESQRDEQLAASNCRLSTLKKGDAVVFDARILHCGNENDEDKGSTRAMLNFSFRNPKETGNLGYDGSIRPEYCGAMNLGDVCNALEAYEKGDPEPFAKYSRL